MQDIHGVQIASVQGTQTRTGGTLYKIKLSNGTEPTTFDANLATKAHQLQGGQLVDVRVDVVIKGDRTYTNLADVAPSGQLSAGMIPAGTQIPVAGAAGAIPMVDSGQNRGGGSGKGMTEEDKQRISRQWAIGSALEWVGDLYVGAGPEAEEEAWQKALSRARELYVLGYAPGQTQTPPGAGTPIPVDPNPIVPTATDPAAVAAQVNEIMGGAVAVGASAPAGGF